MKHEIEHGLSPAMAHEVINHAMASYAERFADYNPSFSWIDDRQAEFGFRARGLSVNGVITLDGSRILVDLSVPLVLRIFKRKALDIIDREVRLWIDRAEKGALDA